MDYLLQIATEKVRKDFGDFTGNFFLILSKKKNLKIDQLNILFPNISYNYIRTAIFNAYRHGIIDLRIYSKNSKKFRNSTNFGINLYPNILNVILRLRTPKFVSRVELEYGLIGVIIFKEIYKKGNLNLRNWKNSQKFKQKRIKKIEDTAIQMTRDKILKCGFVSNQNLFGRLYQKNSLKETCCTVKPNFKDLKSIWKIDLEIIDSLFRLEIILSLTDEIFDQICSKLIRFLLSRFYSVNAEINEKRSFCLDGLIDYVRDLEVDGNFNESRLILSFKTMMDYCHSFLIYGNRLRIFLSNLFGSLEKKIISKLLKTKFGHDFDLAFNLISSINRIAFWDNLKKNRVIEKSRIKKILSEMYRLGLLRFSKTPKNGKNKNPLCPVYPLLVEKTISFRILNETSKSLLNLMIKDSEFSSLTQKYTKKKDHQKFEALYKKQLDENTKVLVLGNIKLDSIFQFFYLIC